jgi:16S rRNA (cytosine1402-N4)-methyltransferase
MEHIPVLLKEAIDGLAIQSKDVFLDGTLGGGGHSALVCEEFGKNVKIIGLDADADAIRRTQARLGEKCDIRMAQTNFRNIEAVLNDFNIQTIDRLLLDLGLSSFQLDEGNRGFSFRNTEPLTMTLTKEPGEEEITASDVVNTWSEEHLADIIYGYGEERYSRKIAHAILKSREIKKIETTTDLAEIIMKAVPPAYRRGKIHPATRTFQAIRIAVNDELGSLSKALESGFERLSSGGRMAIISFHSLEDRIVKNFYKQKSSEERGKIITKKPITPTEEEIRNNPRSRSAKLRIIEKII